VALLRFFVLFVLSRPGSALGADKVFFSWRVPRPWCRARSFPSGLVCLLGVSRQGKQGFFQKHGVEVKKVRPFFDLRRLARRRKPCRHRET